MAKQRTINELKELFREDPGQLTPAELGHLQRLAHAQAKDKEEVDGYQDHKEKAAKRQASLSWTGRDCSSWIGECQNPDRVEACRLNLRLFLETYDSGTFYLNWSDDHLRVIAKLEQAVLRGGQFAMAMPRGSGKTSIVKGACLWAAIYGHHQFVCLIGATDTAAIEMLESIQSDLEHSQALYDDFPKVCGPIRALEGIANRCPGQHVGGNRTDIRWRQNTVVLPTVEGSPASGCIIRVAGITGRVRGMSFKRPDGNTARPSLAVIDDPQTDESARSISQCRKRERVISAAILNLAGPGKKISAVMPCTVIAPGDVADNILDQELHPEWNGERTCLMPKEPTNTRLWKEYRRIRAESLKQHGTIEDATEFYAANREEMDEGAVVSWPERFEPDELSAIQYAMNLKIQDESTYWAEYQNQPLPDVETDDEQMTIDEFCQKLSGIPQRAVGVGRTVLTAFVDMQLNVLPYVVSAWRPDFTGGPIDYETWPRQPSINDWFLRTSRPTIRDRFKSEHPGQDAGLEALLYYALTKTVNQILDSVYLGQGGAEHRVELVLIDAQWGDSTDTVYEFCRNHPKAAMLMPSHGVGITATGVPFSQRKPKEGARYGPEWEIPVAGSRRAIQHVNYDTNHWKNFIHNRALTPIGDVGSLTLFGKKPRAHQRFAEHFHAEFPQTIKNERSGRTVTTWTAKPHQDNHFWDGLVGTAVAASIRGVRLPDVQAEAPKARKKLKLSEIQAEKRKNAKNRQAVTPDRARR